MLDISLLQFLVDACILSGLNSAKIAVILCIYSQKAIKFPPESY